MQYANDLDKASLNHKKNLNNKLTKLANKIANNKTIKNVRKGFRGIKEGFKSLVGRGDMQQYAKDIAAIDQTINHEINFNSRAIADLQQSIAATDLAIENLQTSQMTKAEKFVQENKEYLKEHHLDGIVQDLKDNPNMNSKWIDAQKDIVNSDHNTPSQGEGSQKSLDSKEDDLADRDD